MEPIPPSVPESLPAEPQSIPLKPRSHTKVIWGVISLAAVLIVIALGALAIQLYVPSDSASSEENVLIAEPPDFAVNGLPTAAGTARVPFETLSVTLAPDISKNFDIQEIQNIDDMQQAYGVSFSAEELERLNTDKFVIKNLLDTNLTPVSVGDSGREFVSLYWKVIGPRDYKERKPSHVPFISADVLMNIFSILSVDLLKETENTYLYPQVFSMTKQFYLAAEAKLKSAATPAEKEEWTMVRNYLAVPYALLSTAQKPITASDYWNSDRSVSVEEFQSAFLQQDATVDTIEKVSAFVRSLKLGQTNEQIVLDDIKLIYDAPAKALPNVFDGVFLGTEGELRFEVPFSLFTVRGSYTSSSLRRQYFRAVQWYQQVPFLLLQPKLNRYALRLGELMHNNPEYLKQYEAMADLLGVLVGKDDDLDVRDYAEAVRTLGVGVQDEKKLIEFLDARKPPARIKSLPAFYPTVGGITVAEVVNATRGMRFFSQKFIPDSYWTGRLTQGDEKPEVNGMKLPRSASSLEIMTLLGSEFARTQLPLLPYYATYKGAIDARLQELAAEAKGWSGEYWQSNQVTNILSTVSGLFGWTAAHKNALPQFMQSPLYDAKNLLTASGFWTEMRHTNILYAKQSFAERGGGGDQICDRRVVPPPVYGYVEPQAEAYDRLYFTARLLLAEYQSRSIELSNLDRLESFVTLMETVREYTKLQLENSAFTEPTITKAMPISSDPSCQQHYIAPAASIVRKGVEMFANADINIVAALSRAEELRQGIVSQMAASLPTPVEGPILTIKDKRAGLIADIHTSDDGIVEEGIGVPRVMFVAVKDANGPRLTVGFTYSHYEFLSGKRLTDEEWQTNFYDRNDDYYVVHYKPKASWPELPAWYHQLLGTR